MEQRTGRNLNATQADARAKLLARVYALILSPEWGKPDEPVVHATRRRSPKKQKETHGQQ